jgi:hypothetical protein
MKEIVPLNEDQQKSAFLEAFEERYKSDFLPKDWTDKKKDRIMAVLDDRAVERSTISAIPMVCRGSKCPFASQCPLQLDGEAPVDYPCPYEMGLVKKSMQDFIDTLAVDPRNKIEMSMIRDMANQEVQHFRATRILALEDFIQENTVGVDSDGDPVFRKELHLAVEYEDKIFKRRQALFKVFMATRAEAAKHMTAAMNTAEGLSALMSQVTQAKRASDAALRQLAGLEEHDEYIEAKTRELDEATDDPQQ